MNSPKLGLRALTVGIYLGVFAALPAFGAPKPSPSATPAASPASAEKARPFPFENVVVSVDPATHTFKMGKKTVHQVHVLPETKVLKGEDQPATFEEIVVGIDVRGSVKKRADGDYDAVSVKIGPKAAPSPEASPAASPAKAAQKK